MPTTTKMGIVYPSSTDLVKDGATAMGTISTTVDNKTGLILLNTTSFSSVASVSINDVFSTNYTNYRIIIEAISAAGEVSCDFRLRVSGADETANSYAYTVRSLGSNGTSYNGTASPDTKIFVGRIGGNGRSLLTVDIANPFTNQRTTTVSAAAGDGTTALFGENGSGILRNTTSYTGFTFIASGSTFTSGTVSVYGYNK